MIDFQRSYLKSLIWQGLAEGFAMNQLLNIATISNMIYKFDKTNKPRCLSKIFRIKKKTYFPVKILEK